MARLLRELAAPAEDLSSGLRTMLGGSQAPVTLAPEDLMPSYGLCGHFMHMVHRHTCKQDALIHIK